MTEKNEIQLNPEVRTFILNWGERLSHWGLNRTEAQIFTLLFLTERPLNADEITTTLQVARSNVSQSLKELQSWNIVKPVTVPGDRRKHFDCIRDVWVLFKQVVDEQKRREVDPMISLLADADAAMQANKEDPYIKEKMADMIHFFETTTRWYGKVENMEISTIKKYVKLAGQARKILGK